jgi:hypothetical protein
MTDHMSPSWEPFDPTALTVLRAADGRRLAKRYGVGADGRVAKWDFDNAFMYQTTWVLLDGIHDLFGLLREMEAASDFCAIRGGQAPACDPAETQRTKLAFDEVPRHHVLLDVDGVDLVPGLRVAEDPEAAACAFIARLTEFVPELEGVTVVVRWSTSAGIWEMAERDERWSGVAKRGISAHVWCWLCRPLGEAELTRWTRSVNQRAGFRLLDEATCRTVQPLYTGAPVFTGGLADPLAGKRTILVRGHYDEADLEVPLPDVPAPREGTAPRFGVAHQFGDGGVEYDCTGRVTDGRDAHLSRIAFKAIREAEEVGITPHDHEVVITDRAWSEFERTADLSRAKGNGCPYTRQDAAGKVRQKLSALRAGTLPAAARRSVAGSLALLKALRRTGR